MFSKYKKEHNDLYIKLVDFSRNIFFYKEIKLPDAIETRILLVFFHFSIILKVFKIKKNEKFPQSIYDNIFKNIELNLRELGHGDVSVNKRMKQLLKIFYNILLQIDANPDNGKFLFNNFLLTEYFGDKVKFDDKSLELIGIYFNNFYDKCFAVKSENVIRGDINI